MSDARRDVRNAMLTFVTGISLVLLGLALIAILDEVLPLAASIVVGVGVMAVGGLLFWRFLNWGAVRGASG